MNLAEVFAQGHTVATSRGAIRYVVQCPNPPAPNGWWLIRPEAMPAVVYRRRVQGKDLAGGLSATDLQRATWVVDVMHCWCPECTETRKLSETHGD